MDKIPDEAVKAAAKAHTPQFANMDPTIKKYALEQMRAALTAALPHLPGVDVKKLEWVATGQTGFLETEFYAVAGPLMHTVHPLKDVDGPFNEHYSIHRDWNDRETWRVTYYVGNNGLSGISKACKSLEAAKDAAQADYEARILSALEPSAAREQVLEDALRKMVALYESEYDADVPFKRPDWLVSALSSPDHADAGKVDGDGWKPIESAPKDETLFLAYCPADEDFPDGRMMIWKGSIFAFQKNPTPNHLQFPATHWRPLPSAPSEGAE